MIVRGFQVIITSLALCLSSTLPVLAEEVVRHFQSNISIRDNREIAVTERLTISVEGERVRQGIVRTLPLSIQFPNKPRRKFDIKIVKVMRNGKVTQFKELRRQQLLTIQIYERGVFLEHQDHTFQIEYIISGYNFDDGMFDSFEWYVTGTGWPLKILHVEAHVTFPEMVLPQNVVATGTTAHNSETVSRVRDKGIHFTALDPLVDGDGFSIATTWAKGFFADKKLLVVPDETTEVHQEGEEKLLSVPDGTRVITDNSFLKEKYFTPESIDRLIVDVYVKSNGTLTVSENIVTRYPGDSGQQGLVRIKPLGFTDIQPAFAFSNGTPVTIEKRNAKYFLVNPNPLENGDYNFTFQYDVPEAVRTRSKFDSLRLLVGVPKLKVQIAAVGVRIFPPEFMLPNKDLVTGNITVNRGITLTKPVIVENEKSMVVSSNQGIPPGGLLTIDFQIPKGFIKEQG